MAGEGPTAAPASPVAAMGGGLGRFLGRGSALRRVVAASLAELQDLPDEADAGSPLFVDWGDEGPFQVRQGRGECAS